MGGDNHHTKRRVSSADVLEAIRSNGGTGRGLDFFNCDLSGVELRRANISGMNLQQAVLRGADLMLVVAEDTKLLEADLEGADLQGATLRRANLQGANFTNANIQKAKLGKARLYGANIRQIQNLTRYELEEGPGEEVGSPKDWFLAKEVYLNLRNYFASVGRYDDAGWAFVKERRMERRTYLPMHAHKYYQYDLPSVPRRVLDRLPQPFATAFSRAASSVFYGRYMGKWFVSLLYDLIVGYGEYPGRTVAASLVTIFAFAGVYYRIRFLEYVGDQARDLNLLRQDPDIVSCLYFSLLAFNSVVFGGVLPKLEPLAQLIAGIESFTGVFLTSLFIFSMGRKIGGR